MKISIIAAVAENNVIGGKGGLLWHIEGDLPRFKQITMGHHILMGLNTYNSIGKVLPGRTNLILSSDKNINIPNAYIFDNSEDAIKFADDNGETELMIIGGGMVYKQLLPKTDKIYLTKVLKNYKGDVTFPKIDVDKWNETILERHTETDPNYNFAILERK